MNDWYAYIVEHHAELLEILTGLILVSRMIAALTPSKSDDEIINGFELFVRRLIEVFSGAGHRNLVVKTPEPEIEPVEDVLPENLTLKEPTLSEFREILDRFGAQLKVIPKE